MKQIWPSLDQVSSLRRHHWNVASPQVVTPLRCACLRFDWEALTLVKITSTCKGEEARKHTFYAILERLLPFLDVSFIPCVRWPTIGEDIVNLSAPRMKIPTDILAALAVGKEPVYSLLPAYDDDDITKVGAQPVQLLLKEAFSLLEKDDITKSRRCGQIALDVCWEKLNSGYWRDVPPVWRTLYSYAGLVKCLCHVACREWKESMTWVDMSLLMGAPLPQNSLTQLASVIASRLQSVCSMNALRIYILCGWFIIIC